MTPEEEVLETSRKIRDALFACHREALMELIAEDYRCFNLRGDCENRDALLEVFVPGGMVLEKYEVDELQTDVLDKVGLVTGRGYISGRFGQDTFEHDLRFSDLFVRRGSRWQLFFSQTTPIKTD